MKSVLSTCMAAIAAATLITMPLMTAGPAVATDSPPAADAASTTGTTSMVVTEEPAAGAPAPAPEVAAAPPNDTGDTASAHTESADPAPSAGPAETAAASDPVDTTAPGFFAINPSQNRVFLGDGSEIIDFECSDEESGVKDCALYDHEDRPQTVGVPLVLPVGRYVWTGVAVNSIGLRSDVVIEFWVERDAEPADTTRPEVSSDWDAPAGDWSNRQTLTISSSDSGSGIQDTFVDVDGVHVWNTDTAVVSLEPGSRTIEFWAVDKAGNESEHQSVQVRIDHGLPEIQVDSLIAPDGLAPVEVIQGSSVPFTYTCADALSGIKKCTSAYESGRAIPTSELGEHGFTVDAFDNAGNRTTRMLRYAVVAPTDPIDTTPPSFSSVTPAMNGVYGGQGEEYVEFSCADVESGIETCSLRDHEGNPVAVGAPLELADGDYTWTAIAVNAIGLRTTQAITFSVETPDTTAPHVSSDWHLPAGQWSNRERITISASDTGSGINGIWADYDGLVHVGNTETLEFEPAEGEQIVEYWAADNAGNESEHGVIGVRIDRSKPEIHADSPIARDGLASVEVTKGSSVPFSYTCTDALSGVEKCTSAHESGRTLPTDELGEHTFTVDAFDKAGNRKTRTFTYVVVAATDPAAPSGAGGAVSPGDEDHLAATGSEAGWLPAIAVALLILGTGAIIVHRRRFRA